MARTPTMTFAWPHLLWLLAAPVALLVWELIRTRRLASIVHPKILRAEAGLRGVSLASEDAQPPASSRRRILLCGGVAFAILALARPQWGRLDEPVFDQSRDIIIALDLSRSMLSTDVKPSRLERSKLLIQSLLDRLRGERVGLIVFSGTAFLQSPVSADYEILREFLPALGPDYLPEGGTNYRQLIDTALDAFGENSSADRYLIILSDGEATDEDWKGRIGDLARRGIRVIGLGVGTAGGSMIPDGSGGFMKDESGAVVLSKLESGTLRDLATATHGVYLDASEWVDLSKVLASTVAAGRKGRFVEHNTVRFVERYQWALGLALACLVGSFWLEFPVRPKSREIRLRAPADPKTRAAATLTAASLALFLLVHPTSAIAEDAGEPDPSALLTKIVGRLSTQDQCSALDWAELGRETVTWGQHVRSSNQPVPEQPVRDALAGVEIGSRTDPKVSDWDRLRSELEALLQKPDEKKPPPQKQQDKNDDQKQDQNQDQKQDPKQNQDQKQQSSSSQSGSPIPSQNASQPPPSKPADGKEPPRNQAFGDMSQPTPTPPERNESQQAMQQVGGLKKDEANDPARRDPALAVPLEKLEQLKNQDSPAELFELLRRGEPLPPPTNKGPNW